MTAKEFEDLLDVYGNDVYRFCLHIMRNRENADDLYQDTVLTAFRKADVLNLSENPKSYLLSVAVKLSHNFFRILSVIALYIFICLYVYKDARVNSDKPVLWLLITIFTPNLFGFLIYMLAGRNKDIKPVRKFKIPAIISAVVMVATTVTFTASILFSSDIPVMNNVSIGMVNNNIGSQWEVSYKTSGETLERTIAFTEEELENFTVEGSCEEGEMYLLLLQGKNAQVVDITDFPAQKLQLTDFTAGNIKLSLYNESAKNAKIKIDW